MYFLISFKELKFCLRATSGRQWSFFCRMNHLYCLNVLNCFVTSRNSALNVMATLFRYCLRKKPKPFVFKKRYFPAKMQFWKTVFLDWLHSFKAVKDNKFRFSALHTNKERNKFFKPICGLFIESNVCGKILIY